MQAAINRLTARAPRASFVVSSAFVLALSACSSGEEGASTESSPPAESAPPAVAAAPSADLGAQEAGRVASERRLQDQKADVLVKAYLDTAQGYLDAQDFDRAEQSVLQALGLRKDDPRAIEMFRKVMTLKGRKLETMEDVVDMVRNRRELARQQQLVSVKQRYVAATHDESNGDLDGARQRLEDAQLVIKYDPYETDFGTLKNDVDELHRLVARKLEAARKAAESEQFSEAYKKLRDQEQEARGREDAQVRGLMIAALESFNRGDYDNAEHQANKVLRMRPDHRKAAEVVNASRGARHAAWRDQFLQSRREEFERWMIDVRDAQIPHTAILSWADADKWETIKKRADRGDHVDQAAADTPAVAAIRAKLANDVITVDYSDSPAPFKDVLASIRVRTGINIVADPEVMTEKGEEPVGISLRDHNLGDTLKVILDGMKLAYVLGDEVLKITTAEKALGTPLPRVYEVRDLTVALPDFKAPDLRLTPGPAGEAARTRIYGEDLERVTDTDIGKLSDLIRENCGTGSWDREGHSITPSAGQLVISTTPDVHKQVTAFLDNLRKFNKLTVHVEARFISVTKAFLQDVGIDFRGSGGQNPGTVALLDDVTNGQPNNASAGLDNGGAGLPAAASQSPTNGLFYNNDANNDLRGRTENIYDNALGGVLDNTGGATMSFSILNSDIKINALLRAVEKNIDQTLVNAPRLTIYNRQRANLSIVNQVSYVKDYDVEVAQTAFIADPLVDVVQDGLTLDVRPTVSFDRKWVKLDLEPTVATLIRPIRTFSTNLSGLTVPVIIELPEVTTRTAKTSVNVPNGGWVVIGGLKHVSSVDTRSSTPILGDLPLIGFLFSRKGRSDEIRDLMIILHVKVVDLTEEEKNLDR
jgi:Flp pilus assembly secretin CpaC